MILLADSGSTKTEWWLINGNQVLQKLRTVGFNPYYVTTPQVENELQKQFSGHFEPQTVKKVYFYGAGCSSASKQAVINNALRSLFPGAQTEVEHDLLASARALFGDEPGIACILGTGSNACLYDGNDIAESLFSLGYMFGDEGSGAHLGKTYIAAHLKRRVPQEIYNSFLELLGHTDEEILTNIYQKPNPNRFLASFTVFLKSQLNHPYIFNLVEQCFDDFFKEQVSKFTNYQQMTFGCIGSVGVHFRQVLEISAAKHNIKPEIFLVSPMEGLMNYHLGV
jgi:glucosamine kinase